MRCVVAPKLLRLNLLRLTLPLTALALVGGCPDIELDDVLEEIELDLVSQVSPIQTVDPRFATPPVGLAELQEQIIIQNNVQVITDVTQDLVVAVLPDITLVGFDNLTGDDLFVQYLADGDVQGILVFSGETLLLEYPCLIEIELLTEDHFDPFTGVLVESFDLEDGLFINPFDFDCGEAVIFTFDPFGVISDVVLIDLLR